MEPFEPFLERQLDALANRSLLRDTTDPGLLLATASAARLGLPLLNACSNDYLGLGARPHSDQHPEPVGAGASRLVYGTRSQHRGLEQGVAAWLQVPAALAFSSGYAANLGLLNALASAEDLIVSDELNHASIIDGCRLSRATVRRYRHLDTADAYEQLQSGSFRRRWLVSESYFSMDGNSPDLAALRAAALDSGAALLVDEAHALGVFGPQGRGLCADAAVSPDALMGTFGKAIGGQGAFVAGSEALRTWLWNRARPFVYSTAQSPLLAARLRDQVAAVAAANPDRAHLQALTDRFAAGFPRSLAPEGRHGPIFPLLCGSVDRAQKAADQFLSRGILVQVIRPPTVADGSCRLRLTLSARFTWNDLERLEGALEAALSTL